MKRELNQNKKLAILFTILLAFIMSESGITTIDTYAASKKYTKTYSLKRNYKKTIKLKSKIKSIKSSNNKIATVKKSGKKFTITAKKKGTAIITVKCKNKKTYRYKVKVSNKKHTHEWNTEEWTEQVSREECVEYIVCNSCQTRFSSVSEVHTHQDATGKDGTCNSCGTYYAHHSEFTEYNAQGQWRYTCPNCGSHDFDRPIAHHGWHNTYEYVTTYTTITHHRKVCACGATENID